MESGGGGGGMLASFRQEIAHVLVPVHLDERCSRFTVSGCSFLRV